MDPVGLEPRRNHGSPEDWIPRALDDLLLHRLAPLTPSAPALVARSGAQGESRAPWRVPGLAGAPRPELHEGAVIVEGPGPASTRRKAVGVCNAEAPAEAARERWLQHRVSPEKSEEL